MNRLLGRLSSGFSSDNAGVPQIRSIRGDAPPPLEVNMLTTILDAMDSQPEDRRIGTGLGQYGHYSHVSSLIGACARMHGLAAMDERRITETVTGGHRVMWNIGRSVEKHIRSQYLLATHRRRAYGIWGCPCGRSSHVGQHPTAHCITCDRGLDTYHEHPLFDHDNWIVGNPDLLVQLDGGWIVPVEIKSMTPKQFDKLSAPKGDHLFQLGHYHRMLSLNNFKAHSTGIVIYCTKEFKYGSPYKEFHFDFSVDSAEKTLIEDSLSVARAIRRTREEGALPPRTLCQSATDTTAKNCPFLVQCFSRR